MIMVLYLGMVLIGYFAGAFLKKKEIELKWTGKLQIVCLFTLVFVMGSRIGSNEEVVASLGTIGLVAFALTVLAFAGSLLCVSLTRKAMGFDKKGVRSK